MSCALQKHLHISPNFALHIEECSAVVDMYSEVFIRLLTVGRDKDDIIHYFCLLIDPRSYPFDFPLIRQIG